MSPEVVRAFVKDQLQTPCFALLVAELPLKVAES